MEIKKLLLAADPSRYTVHQLLHHIKDTAKLELIEKDLGAVFCIKTKPYIDSLYNYAYVFKDNFNKDDVLAIKNFFDEAAFRIKILGELEDEDFLYTCGFKLKDAGWAMINQNIKSKDFNYIIPDGVKIIAIEKPENLEHFKKIFAEAFNHQVSAYDCKFGFLNDLVLSRGNEHLKFFVIYENNVPVSTGGYYAFDKFSIENIGTAASVRGRGYASLMVKILLQEAQRLGYDEVCLVGSEAALSIYQKAGFEVLSKHKTFINY